MIKNLSKNDIENRYKNSNHEPITTVENVKPIFIGAYKLDKLCTVVIPGHPIIDSRPRFRQDSYGNITTYNPHKAQLMRIFKYMYDQSTILQGITILSPMYIELTVYEKISQPILKLLNEKEKKLLKDGNLINPTKPDVDNAMKINYDVLQDDKYSIILRDEAVVDSKTNKFFVLDKADERVEIKIYYTDNLPNWYKEYLYNSTDYLRYTLSNKYRIVNNISNEEYHRFFFRTITDFFKRTKKDVTTAVKYLSSTYNKEVLDILVGEHKNLDISRDKLVSLVETLIIELKIRLKKRG